MPELHCWEGQPTEIGEPGGTCMLMRGHAGDHEWTPDSEIGVTFAPLPPTPEQVAALVAAAREATVDKTDVLSQRLNAALQPFEKEAADA